MQVTWEDAGDLKCSSTLRSTYVVSGKGKNNLFPPPLSQVFDYDFFFFPETQI